MEAAVADAPPAAPAPQPIKEPKSKAPKPAPEPPRMTLREALNQTPGVSEFLVDDTCPVGDALAMLITIIGRTGYDRENDKFSQNERLVAGLMEQLEAPLPSGIEPCRAGPMLGADEVRPPGSANEIQFWSLGSGKRVIRPLARDKAKRPATIAVGTSGSEPKSM